MYPHPHPHAHTNTHTQPYRHVHNNHTNANSFTTLYQRVTVGLPQAKYYDAGDKNIRILWYDYRILLVIPP